jgi:hypothetical protein
VINELVWSFDRMLLTVQNVVENLSQYRYANYKLHID